MRPFPLIFRITLILGLIGLFTFTNFDLGYNTSLNNSLATETTATENNQIQGNQTQSNSVSINAQSGGESTNQNPEQNLDQSPEIYTVQKANTNANLGAFDPNEIPYFETQTIPASSDTTTIQITNRWNTSITIALIANDEISSSFSLDAVTTSSEFELTPANDTTLSIWTNDVNGFRNWLDIDHNYDDGFISTSGKSASQAGSLTHIPDIRYFTTDSSGTRAGDNFFKGFFFYSKATSLPAGTFNISTITEVGDYFFSFFVDGSNLSSLPDNSFDTSNIISVGDDFFSYFICYTYSIKSLPEGSFDITGITTAGDYFFYDFAQASDLTSLPEGSFDTSRITTVGNSFFGNFVNFTRSLTSLPEYSFDTSNITKVGNDFFAGFASSSASLTSLPDGSFDISGITSAGDYFFSSFASSSTLPTLPKGSFNTSNITSVGDSFFDNFAMFSNLTSLPEGSFDISNITSAGDGFFTYFIAYSNSMTSLPDYSFDTSNITTAGDYFFYAFNVNGPLTSLPIFSFNFDNLVSHEDYAFFNFNAEGSLTSLPYNSFNFEKVTTLSTADSWSLFNDGGKLTKANSGINIINTSDKTQTFYWAVDSVPNSGWENISSGSTFIAYSSVPAATFTISFETNGGSKINPVTALQSQTFTQPANPTRSGYRFVQWLVDYADGNPYDWSSAAKRNLTLYAQWEKLPAPNPTPSPSNSLPSTGDESLIIFSFTGTFLLLAIISFAIYYLKRKSKNKIFKD